jgi:hypothetical protein
MDDLVNNLKKALECPCCLEPPKPNPVAVGMCVNGHMTCEPCTVNVLQVSNYCPVCRQRDFKVVRGHSLAVSVIQILTACLIYSCKHPNCTEQKNGNEIAQHEATCSLKPIKCPKTGCNHASPIDFFMGSLHFSCVEICELTTNAANTAWNFVVAANNIYSFDHNEVRVSDKFKPVILRGTTPNNYVSHAYINLTIRNGLLIFYSGWLNDRDCLDDKYKQLKVQLFVYANTPYGKTGLFARVPLMYQGQELAQEEDGVCVPRHLVYNWLKWSSQVKCPTCTTNNKKAHLHVEVSFHYP